jgi:hypothetical protein
VPQDVLEFMLEEKEDSDLENVAAS